MRRAPAGSGVSVGDHLRWRHRWRHRWQRIDLEVGRSIQIHSHFGSIRGSEREHPAGAIAHTKTASEQAVSIQFLIHATDGSWRGSWGRRQHGGARGRVAHTPRGSDAELWRDAYGDGKRAFENCYLKLQIV